MRIVTRYVLREHAGPLAFTLTALTSLLLLQYVARQLEKLVGKGLPWQVIVEFLVLSVPFTVAMTLPMAVLMATLHAFGRMAAEHEITAFRASGVRVRALMRPVTIAAALLSLGMLAFNDQVLPRANYRLARLLTDIGSTRPTLALEQQVLKEIGPGYYMRVQVLDPLSNRMQGITLHDVSNPAERTTVYADSGTIAQAANGRDLELVLFDGVQVQFPRGDVKQLQRTFFRSQALRLQNVLSSFTQSDGSRTKSDRERTICELQTEYERVALDYESMRQRYIGYLRANAPEGTETLRVPRPRPAVQGIASWYCRGLAWAQGQAGNVGVQEAQAADVGEAWMMAAPPFAAVTERTLRVGPDQDSLPQDSLRRDSLRQDSLRRDSLRRDSLRRDSAAVAATIQPPAVTPPAVTPPGVISADSLQKILSRSGAAITPNEFTAVDSGSGVATTPQPGATPIGADTVRPLSAVSAIDEQLLQAQLEQMSGIAVEVQKKFALSFACLVFVLFGPPIALRFPRGGVGVTIGVSLAVFAAYYVCLIAGESLADKGMIHPIVAMWAANVLFTAAGLWLVSRVEKGADMSRGGGLRERWRDRRARRTILAERARATAASPAAPAVS